MSCYAVSRIAGFMLPTVRSILIPRTFTTTNRKCSTLPVLDAASYDKVCTETLESLSDYFEEIVESAEHLKLSDITYGDGVLTVKLGIFGSYVINRQTPNKQIWLSSPTSGPKRYDFVGTAHIGKGMWIYKHSGESLHELLQNEIKEIAKTEINFFKLPYSKIS